jgi:hypothetical protein
MRGLRTRRKESRFLAVQEREPRHSAGLSSNSALVRVLAGLLAGLLLSLLRLRRLLTGLLTLLLARLVGLAALLRLALVVLIHVNLQKLLKKRFECSSFKLP